MAATGCDPCPSCSQTTTTIPTGSFTATGSMGAQRFGHSASLLSDGTVLVAGGLSGALTNLATVDLAEIFDPASDSASLQFSPGAAMVRPRESHTATLLKGDTQTGKVLIAGGDNGRDALSSAELFDPATGQFKQVAAVMTAPRTGHTATGLPNGSPDLGRVLIVGGSPAFDSATGVFVGSLSSAELFDPRSGGQFEPLPFDLNVARSGHAATLLDPAVVSGPLAGTVLITGGVDQQGLVQSSAELFEAPLAPFVPAGNMTTARFFHASVLLNNGTVLIAGGIGADQNLLASAEIYDPTQRSFHAVGSMVEARRSPAAVMLSNGQALIVGGSGDDSAEIYNPDSQSFTLITASATQRLAGTATLLSDQTNVLIAGGFQLTTANQFTDVNATQPEAELFDTATGAFPGVTGSMQMVRAYHTATLLDSHFVTGPLADKVLIVGGRNLSGAPSIGSAQTYDPAAGAFGAAIALIQARFFHTATVLSSGQVLLAGGLSSSGSLSSAELYNPAGKSSSATGSLITARNSATATRLSDGEVLIAGGEQVGAETSTVLNTAELYNPAAGSFRCVGGPAGSPPACNPSMTAARFLHAAAGLAGGTVLLTGGVNNGKTVLSSAEVYDPAQGAFHATGSMNRARVGHTATFLDPQFVSGASGGKVLIAGGTDDLSAELYDPAAGTFTLVGNMNAVHSFHTATLLKNGRVLIAGGGPPDFSSLINGQLVAEQSAEVFDPASATFVPVGNMLSERALQTATLLNGGNVLITGGEATNSVQAGAELFVPADPQVVCTVCGR